MGAGNRDFTPDLPTRGPQKESRPLSSGPGPGPRPTDAPGGPEAGARQHGPCSVGPPIPGPPGTLPGRPPPWEPLGLIEPPVQQIKTHPQVRTPGTGDVGEEPEENEAFLAAAALLCPAPRPPPCPLKAHPAARDAASLLPLRPPHGLLLALQHPLLSHSPCAAHPAPPPPEPRAPRRSSSWAQPLGAPPH